MLVRISTIGRYSKITGDLRIGEADTYFMFMLQILLVKSTYIDLYDWN